MLRSMTAYGRSALKTANGDFLCELRSVNHRYLDISVRLSDGLQVIESGIRQRLAAQAQRGKIDVQVKMSGVAAAQASMSINEDLIRQLAEAARRVAEISDTVRPPDALRLLQWPGVICDSEDTQALQSEDALTCFDAALSDFVACREREGEQIARLLTRRTEQIRQAVADVRKSRPAVQLHLRDKLMSRLGALELPHDDARLEQELVYAAQKLDIEEELDRLDAHCQELNIALKRTEPVGRRLDFLMQEFNREANTLTAKSHDTQTTASAIDIKVLVEQMREQIQNVE